MEKEVGRNEGIKRIGKKGVKLFYQIKEKMKTEVNGVVFYPKDTQILDTALELLYNKLTGENK